MHEKNKLIEVDIDRVGEPYSSFSISRIDSTQFYDIVIFKRD